MRMKLGVKIQLLTFWSQVFNFLFLALGVSLFLCAIWIQFGSGNLLAQNPGVELRTVAAGLFLIGAVVAVVSVIGFLSVAKEHRLLLLTFLCFLLVLFLGLLYITLLLRLSQGKFEKSVTETLHKMIQHYKGETDADTLMDNIQDEGYCGVEGPSDWLKNFYIQSLNRTDLLPCSCFTRHSYHSIWCSIKEMNMLNSTVNGGCHEKVSNWLLTNINTITGMDISLMVVQVILFGLVVDLYRSIGRNEALKRIPQEDADHTSLSHDPREDMDGGEQNYSYIDPDDGLIDPAYVHDDERR